MAKIELFFGNPTTEKRMDEVEEWACDRDVNIETANIQNFRVLMRFFLFFFLQQKLARF